MHLLWVQQLAVLPVIVEDRNIMEESVQGGGLPLESQSVEASARSRLGERERPTTQARRFHPLPFPFLSSSLCFSIPSFALKL